MKLVLIQGLHMAAYNHRQQISVIRLESWVGDYDFKGLVEDYRVYGAIT